MSRITPGRPAKGDWRRSTSTALPGQVYGYYVDIDFECQAAQYSPKTTQDEASGAHKGTQTIYLGAFMPQEFNFMDGVIIAAKLEAWKQDHPACMILHVGEPYRHYRGS